MVTTGPADTPGCRHSPGDQGSRPQGLVDSTRPHLMSTQGPSVPRVRQNLRPHPRDVGGPPCGEGVFPTGGAQVDGSAAFSGCPFALLLQPRSPHQSPADRGAILGLSASATKARSLPITQSVSGIAAGPGSRPRHRGPQPSSLRSRDGNLFGGHSGTIPNCSPMNRPPRPGLPRASEPFALLGLTFSHSSTNTPAPEPSTWHTALTGSQLAGG